MDGNQSGEIIQSSCDVFDGGVVGIKSGRQNQGCALWSEELCGNFGGGSSHDAKTLILWVKFLKKALMTSCNTASLLETFKN